VPERERERDDKQARQSLLKGKDRTIELTVWNEKLTFRNDEINKQNRKKFAKSLKTSESISPKQIHCFEIKLIVFYR
jgi:hypothetical protein